MRMAHETVINNPLLLRKRIADELKRHRYTQEQYASVLHMSQPMVSRRLAGKASFTVMDIQRTAEWLQLSTDYLYGLTEDPTPATEMEQVYA